MVFVKPTVRQSLLAKMLSELLDTRVMVKSAMKLAKGDKVCDEYVRRNFLTFSGQALLRLLDARQLSLKFIANVTYGYTSASFSGRMPAVEIADAIVQSGRETLEKAIAFIESHDRWGARVVYGDTDSLFIYLPGKTKEEAFRIGNDIADQVTAHNPPPIKLKFEKVGVRVFESGAAVDCKRFTSRAFFKQRSATWASSTNNPTRLNQSLMRRVSRPCGVMEYPPSRRCSRVP
jgi:DNA polymerase zeta